MHRPSWFSDDSVLIVNASTCGINKDGKEQYLVNPDTGIRSISEIDDRLAECCDAITNGDFDRKEIFYFDYDEMVEKDVFVPKYYDFTSLKEIENVVNRNKDLKLMSLGELSDSGDISIFNGHGSPSSDQRLGSIPYIKVSDLRAGHVNINPTNMVPIDLAKKFWGGESSKLKPYDLVSPERASKNIGEFCILMPGQQNVVFTREVIIIRAINNNKFDQFYLMWAFSLNEVRKQWERVVFMQTNREDVGKRMLEIKIPIPNSKTAADKYSKSFSKYYLSLENSRSEFISSISNSEFNHHIYLGE
ncbi:hypothetical protein ACS5F0_004075 [Providencia rettgeri]